MRIGTLKESYIADAALFDSRTQKTWLAVAAALLVLFPFMASDYWLYLACLVSINVASATGLNILTGYTGLVSLGQAAFMGLGAYTVAVMETRLGPAGAVLGRFYALFALLMAFAMGAMAQSGALADTFSAAFTLPRWRVGLVTAALALTILLGGIRRIADISTVLVPVMALLYLGGGLAVILGNLRRLPEAVTLMLRCAVVPEAALGGALGIVTRREALRWGVARSVFSNEAGLGSAAITAACADTEDPVKQGLISMTGVFFDTMVICSVTGLAICCSGTLGTADGAGRPLTGAALTLRAFETVLGPLAPWLIGVALGLFAFTSVLGCAVQAETTASYLLGPEAVRPCRVLYGLAVFAGAVIPMATVLQLADLANALMAFPNLVCLLLLSGEIAGECGRKER